MITIIMKLRRLRASHVAALIAIAAATLCVAGCGPKGESGSMTAALNAYQSQRYTDAHKQASAVMAKSASPQRERAAYLAGLSAYQMGNLEAAEAALVTAAGSSDVTTAGNARVMLGQLRLDQHRPREAATNFSDASRMLKGEDARQAAWHAGLAFREGGDEDAAKRWLDTASSSQFDAPTQATASGKPSKAQSLEVASNKGAPVNGATAGIEPTPSTSVGFTLQVGAFTDKKRAKRAAEEAEDLAEQQSIGRVRIILRKDARNQPLYLVQVGWWVTRNEAAKARAKVGKLEYIVAPAAPVS